MNLAEARGKVESITATPPPAHKPITKAATNAWAAASISLLQGVCPTCGETLEVTERFNKLYYQCKVDAFHYFIRDSAFGSSSD